MKFIVMYFCHLSVCFFVGLLIHPNIIHSFILVLPLIVSHQENEEWRSKQSSASKIQLSFISFYRKYWPGDNQYYEIRNTPADASHPSLVLVFVDKYDLSIHYDLETTIHPNKKMKYMFYLNIVISQLHKQPLPLCRYNS